MPIDTPKPPVDLASQEYQKSLAGSMKNWSSACDEINRLTAKRHRRIPEPYFKTHILPFVRAWIVNDPNNAPEIGFWLNVADGLNNEISVVDDKDQLLFTVPPPFVDIPLRTDAPTGKRLVTLHSLVTVQGDMADNGDQRGFWDVERQLVEICAPKREDHDKTKYLVMLVKIYDRYDLPLEELVGSLAPEIRLVLKSGKTTASPNKLAEQSSDDDEPDNCIY